MNMYFTLVFNFAFFNIISNLEFNCPSECSCSDFYSSVSERAEPKSAECRLDSVADVIKFPTLHPELQFFKLASGSEIESVSEDTFRATQQIEEILMNNSGLKEIGKESFSGFPNLRLVNLSGNEMELLSFEAFWKLESESVTGTCCLLLLQHVKIVSSAQIVNQKMLVDRIQAYFFNEFYATQNVTRDFCAIKKER